MKTKNMNWTFLGIALIVFAALFGRSYFSSQEELEIAKIRSNELIHRAKLENERLRFLALALVAARKPQLDDKEVTRLIEKLDSSSSFAE